MNENHWNTPNQTALQRKDQTRKLAISALMVAISVVLSAYRIPIDLFGAYALRVGFDVIPWMFVAVTFGPIYGGLAAAAADTVSFMFFGRGAFNPLFTLSAVVMALIPAIMFMRDDKTKPLNKIKLGLAMFLSQTVGSVIINTAILVLMFNLPFEVWIPRAVSQVIDVPLYAVGTYLLHEIWRTKIRKK